MQVLGYHPLSGWPHATIAIVCQTRGWPEEREVAALLTAGDLPLVEVRAALAAGCPRRDALEPRDRCDTAFERPQGT